MRGIPNDRNSRKTLFQIPLRQPRRVSGRIPRTGAFFRRAGRTTNWRFVRIRMIPTQTASSRIFPGPCAIVRAWRSRWCAADGSKVNVDLTNAADAMSSFRCPGTPHSICSAPSWRGCATVTAQARCSADPTAGRARAAFTTRKARSTAFSTWPWEATSGPSTPIVPALPRSCCPTSSATTSRSRSAM